jgi:hypothetical protein
MKAFTEAGQPAGPTACAGVRAAAEAKHRGR